LQAKQKIDQLQTAKNIELLNDFDLLWSTEKQ